MWSCDSCGRHLLPGTPACPFCAGTRIATAGMAMLTPLVLSACYGAPPCAPDDLQDNDNDGFSEVIGFCDHDEPEDCDDGDAAINPDAEEVCGNEVDENCDYIVAGPEQEEVCNGLDDDCDDEIDEDGACDTGAPPTIAVGGLELDLTWASSTAVTSCAEAGNPELSVTLDTPTTDPVTSTVPCADHGVLVDELAEGQYALSVTGTAGDRTWTSETTAVAVFGGATEKVDLTLTCAGAGC